MPRSRDNFFALTPPELSVWLTEQGERPFRVKQVLQWVYGRWALDFDGMSNLSVQLRRKLGASFCLGTSERVDTQASSDGSTAKYLLEFPDGERVECVLMRDRRGASVCLSCQAGCGLGCRFCATGSGGFRRNLTAGEIVEQAWRMAADAEGFSRVVFMGMGEPLRNLEGVVPALEALADEARFGIGARRITLSTCGIASGINELARSPVHPHLALSLNSPFEEERRELMPGTRRHPLAGVLKACAEYIEATGRQLTFEYVLLKGVNDTRRHSRALAELAREHNATVNLIPYNPVDGAGFHPPDTADSQRFKAWLETARARVSTRYRRGRDIQAGCGQLRGKHTKAR